MTLIAAIVWTLLSIGIATGLAAVGAAAAGDTRVQLAADAAALAAVGESGPGGSGQPATAADRWARLNGARVVGCICVPGSSSMQVTVAIGDVEATARAEIDPWLIRPALPPLRMPGSWWSKARPVSSNDSPSGSAR